MSGCGTEPTSGNVRNLVAIGSEADIGQGVTLRRPFDRLRVREPRTCNSARRISGDAWSRCAYASLHEGRERVLPPRLPERRESIQHAGRLYSKGGLCTE